MVDEILLVSVVVYNAVVGTTALGIELYYRLARLAIERRKADALEAQASALNGTNGRRPTQDDL